MSNLSESKNKGNKRILTYSDNPIHHLYELIDEKLLNTCLKEIGSGKSLSSDVDSLESFKKDKDTYIPKLIKEVHLRVYRPSLVNTKQVTVRHKLRSIGKLNVEDSLLQKAVSKILAPIYERLFFNFSFGYRNGKSPNDALSLLHKHITFDGCRYIIKADLKDYFNAIDHACLIRFLKENVEDEVIMLLIEQWLNAGVGGCGDGGCGDGRCGGRVVCGDCTRGLLTGAVLSPLLSNIYLHHILDTWFVKQVKPQLRELGIMIRYCDDFVIGFNNLQDAKEVYRALFAHLSQYKLYLNQIKTRLISLPPNSDSHHHAFTFLGYHHWLDKTYTGKEVLRRRKVR
ncbi:hypothetical protein EYV94_27545 [Puteibacter caeruleilacunae]|nr:hypothetical protein EYV94_27545 [Puteibacter caeruleilacunae]